MTAEDSFESTDSSHKIRNILVVPSADILLAKHAGFNDAAKKFIAFVEEKMGDCREAMANTLAVTFALNHLQNRSIPIEIGTHLTSVYQELRVSKTEEFVKKTNELLAGDRCAPETAALAEEVDDVIAKWDALLQEMDDVLEPYVGRPEPYKRSDDSQKAVTGDNLVPILKDSRFDMLFIGVVLSFANPDATEYVTKIYQLRREFNFYGCDIFLLTKDGGGFLKLIGVPSSTIDDGDGGEQQLQIGFSALEAAGSKALHMCAEIGCSADSLKMKGGTEDGVAVDYRSLDLATVGGAAIVNKQGKVLYSFTGSEPKEWPEVDTVLRKVKKLNGSDDSMSECEEKKSPEEKSAVTPLPSKSLCLPRCTIL
ncbi:hypothetical protein L596_002958 [Steinernema carpocapsae]|uniref:Uncharacterized protein n=1 Tax=Steinernema carpocapsae TaxID=34508 RepID=A0A4U8UUW4_STECR|nr:hypothetical protein L596_002958 [Steinernema carpocapsae]